MLSSPGCAARASRFTALSAVLIIIGTAISPASAQGGGVGGGSTGGGTIYFINGGSTNYTWSMTSTGSGVTQLEWWGYFNVPSRVFDNGHRWYLTTLTIPNEYYGDGITQRSEVFALRGDYDTLLNNNPDTRVQLTNDPTLQPAFGSFQGMHWLPSDVGVSFKARRWLGAVPVEGGLYTVTLVYGPDGNIVGITEQPNAPVLSFALDATGWPALGRHTWGLSTTQVAYIDSPETGLWVANLSTGAQTRIYSGGVGSLDWSQDGTKILFGGGTIRTIKPNGTGLKTVIGPRYVNNVWVSGFAHAYFSPTASHITCVGVMSLPGGGLDNDVIRATSTGGSVSNLTNTASVPGIPIGWR